MNRINPADRLLTPGEVAVMFRVDPKTVIRWAKAGRLPTATRTLGNHRRFSERVVRTLLSGGQARGGEA